MKKLFGNLWGKIKSIGSGASKLGAALAQVEKIVKDIQSAEGRLLDEIIQRGEKVDVLRTQMDTLRSQNLDAYGERERARRVREKIETLIQ